MLMPMRSLPSGGEEDRRGLGLYLHSGRQAHDGKVLQLVLLDCAQFWQALLVGCSIPPTTKIKTKSTVRISLWNKLTNSPHQIYYWITVLTLHLLIRQIFHKHLLSSLDDHGIPKKSLSLYTQAEFPEKPGVNAQNGMTSILTEYYFCSLWHSIKFNISSLGIWYVQSMILSDSG